MATYRYQATCVGLWRGKIKRWNTRWYRSTSTQTSALSSLINAVCFKQDSDVMGDCSGGLASISVYDNAGGPPILVTTYFDWETPSTWIPFNGNAWGSLPAGTPLDASGESALVIVGHLPGLSASGKPMSTRRYIHAIPSRTAADFSDPDVPAGVITQLATWVDASWMAGAKLVAPSSVEFLNYYGNHQRVRGRRRPKAQVAAQSFSAGVIVGAQPSASGGGTPFQPK